MKIFFLFLSVFLLAFVVTLLLGFLFGLHKNGRYSYLIGLSMGVGFGNAVMHVLVLPNF